jgi:hypothetical protein
MALWVALGAPRDKTGNQEEPDIDDILANATAIDADGVEPQEHGNRLARNALSLAAIVAASSFASRSSSCGRWKAELQPANTEP